MLVSSSPPHGARPCWQRTGSAFKEQLCQFLWLNPMPCFQLRGWIGVHKEGISPGSEFLLRLLLCLKETDFTPVPLLVVCPDLPACIHRDDNLYNLAPYTHIPLHFWTLPPASCPPPRSSLLRQESLHRPQGPSYPRA